MSHKRPLSVVALALGLFLSPAQPAFSEDLTVDPASFAQWVEGFKADAAKKGISQQTISTAFDKIEPVKRVLELDRKQPEFTLTFWKYLDGRVNDKRIKRGRSLLKKHAKLLASVEKKYGVQPRFLVAFWGLETNFGDYTGVFPLIPALATLAHDKRRSKFFTAELIDALKVMDRGDFTPDIKASWAGAMGQCQFIPSTYLRFATDFDGDGKRDLWGSLPDVFGSSANYLSKSGWQGDKTWGREVTLPKDFDLTLAGLGRTQAKTLAEWQKLGLRRMNGKALPSVDLKAHLILPAGYQGPKFLVYQNFRSILIWNRSLLYAVAVGHLADRLIGKGALVTPKPEKEVPLSRNDVMDIQRLLTNKGFDTDGTDGVIGPNSRKAIIAYQKKHHLPPDGYPTFGLLERLRGTGGGK